MLVQYTKRRSLEKKKRRPVTLSLALKVHERVIKEQTSNYFFFSEILFDLRKAHSARHSLFKFLASA